MQKNDFISKKAAELMVAGVPHKDAINQAYDEWNKKYLQKGGETVDWSLHYQNGGGMWKGTEDFNKFNGNSWMPGYGSNIPTTLQPSSNKRTQTKIQQNITYNPSVVARPEVVNTPPIQSSNINRIDKQNSSNITNENKPTQSAGLPNFTPQLGEEQPLQGNPYVIQNASTTEDYYKNNPPGFATTFGSQYTLSGNNPVNIPNEGSAKPMGYIDYMRGDANLDNSINEKDKTVGEQDNTYVNNYQYFNPYGGVDIPTSAYTLGQGIGSGNTLETVGSGVKLGLGLGRNLLAGMGQANRRKYIMQDYQNKAREASVPMATSFQEGGYVDSNNYPPQNIIYCDGGEKYYQEGGEQQQPSPEQIIQAFAQMSKQDPQAIMQQLQAMSPEDQQKALSQMVQALQGGGQEEQGEMNNNAQEEAQEAPQMQEGGVAPVMLTPAQIKAAEYQKKRAAQQAANAARLAPIEAQQEQRINVWLQSNPGATRDDYFKANSYQNNVGVPGAIQMGNDKPSNCAWAIQKQDGGFIFQEGGQLGLRNIPPPTDDDLHKTLTGNFVAEQPTDKPIVAQIEKSEYMQTPDGNITKALGEKHKDGGVNLDEDQIPPGSKIISNHLQIGKEYKTLAKELDLKLDKTDTYAKVLDKWTKHTGLEKLILEQADLIKDLEKQAQILKDKPESESTISLNINHIQKKIKALDDKKAPLEDIRKGVFARVFDLQEASKSVEQPTPMKQMGGVQTYNGDMIMGYNLPPQKLTKGGSGYYQGGGKTPEPFITPSIYAMSDYPDQSFIPGYEGEASGEFVPSERAKQQMSYLPYSMQNSGFYNQGELNLKNTGNFQEAVDKNRLATISAIDYNPNLTAEEKAKYKKIANDQAFKLSTKKTGSYDKIYGLETSARTGYTLPYITEEDKKKYPSLQRLGDAIDENGKIKADYKDLNLNTKKLILDTYNKEGKHAFDIGLGVVGEPAKIEAANPQQEIPERTGVTQYGILPLPSQISLMPDSLQGALKQTHRYERTVAPLQSPDAMIQEIRRTTQAAKQTAYQNLPPQQAAAVAANYDTTEQDQINKIMSQVGAQNNELTFKNDVNNQQVGMAEENQRAADLQNYENKILKADAITQQNMRKWINRNQQVNLMNYQTVDNVNNLNRLYPNFQYAPTGVENTEGYKQTYGNLSAEDARANREELAKIEKAAQKKKINAAAKSRYK